MPLASSYWASGATLEASRRRTDGGICCLSEVGGGGVLASGASPAGRLNIAEPKVRSHCVWGYGEENVVSVWPRFCRLSWMEACREVGE